MWMMWFFFSAQRQWILLSQWASSNSFVKFQVSKPICTKAMCCQSGVGIQKCPWYRNFSLVLSWIFLENIWGCLSLSLSLKKLTKEHIQPIIDKIADQLLSWNGDLMTRAGRRIQVQFVLTAMLIYLAMAIDFPPWAIKAMDKL
jgi:hypothetical protein